MLTFQLSSSPHSMWNQNHKIKFWVTCRILHPKKIIAHQLGTLLRSPTEVMVEGFSYFDLALYNGMILKTHIKILRYHLIYLNFMSTNTIYYGGENATVMQVHYSWDIVPISTQDLHTFKLKVWISLIRHQNTRHNSTMLT